MHPHVMKARKKQAEKKLKKAAYSRRASTLNALNKAEALKRAEAQVTRMSAKEWVRAKFARVAAVVKYVHASVMHTDSPIQREIITAAIAKRERKAIDVHGMRCAHA